MSMEMVAPAAVGLSEKRLARAGAVMQDYVDRGLIPGTVTLLARRGKVVHLQAQGMMDREAGKPMQTDTIFRIYSMSKPITCAAAMLLFEEGRFLLNDPVAQYLPEFAHVKVYAGCEGDRPVLVEPERPVTIHHLLTHTSGLSYGGLLGTPLEAMYRDANLLDPLIRLQAPLAELPARLAALPLVRQPGTGWHYGLSHDVIGRLIEVISGMPFDRFLAERLFGPLGMVDTGFYVPPAKIERFAAMYGPATNAGLPLLDAPEASPYTRTNYVSSGGGGMVSTAADYLRFASMLLNGGELDSTRLLSRKTVALITCNHVPSGQLSSVSAPDMLAPGYGYGLGVGVLMDPGLAGVLGSSGQYGWDGAATTQFWVDPQEQMIGIFMAQVLPWTTAPLVMHLYQTLAHQAIVD
jgi:CubicO group peptidase (beta-lactamase class C family)